MFLIRPQESAWMLENMAIVAIIKPNTKLDPMPDPKPDHNPSVITHARP